MKSKIEPGCKALVKASTLLREAKKHLRLKPGLVYCPNLSPFICLAVDIAAEQQGTPEAWNAAHRATFRITEALGPSHTLRSWLELRISNDQFNFIRLQAHRLAWMERLALEFESEGD